MRERERTLASVFNRCFSAVAVKTRVNSLSSHRQMFALHVPLKQRCGGQQISGKQNGCTKWLLTGLKLLLQPSFHLNAMYVSVWTMKCTVTSFITGVAGVDCMRHTHCQAGLLCCKLIMLFTSHTHTVSSYCFSPFSQITSHQVPHIRNSSQLWNIKHTDSPTAIPICH